MIGNLYLITNSCNDKKYVGKTCFDILSRFSEHKSKARNGGTSKFSKAIREIGEDNFSISLISQHEDSDLENKEIETIAKLDSITNGYNTSLGGLGYRTLDLNIDDVILDYSITGSLRKTAHKFNTTAPSIAKILKANNVEQTFIKTRSVTINECNKTFNSIVDCAKYIMSLGISTAQQKSICDNINKCLSGKKKSFLNMTFV